MMLLNQIMPMILAQAEHAQHVNVARLNDQFSWASMILWLPALSTLLCGLCAALKIKNKLPAWITVASLGTSFVLTLLLYINYSGPTIVHIFDWLNLGWTSNSQSVNFIANFSLYVDSLTLLWMLFVTGLGTLIALYASEYMESDVGKGYTRFFAGVSIFLFAMTALVMGDNLVMLYLGWEGVGFASYWLIGYYYTRPSAVAAAKKAFIVNRIGDLGLALGIYLIWHNFGTVEYSVLFEILNGDGYSQQAGGWSIHAIPYLLMLGAFGKSAQIPLFVWLPDAMEGPTPVSALIHAATMVTAGVYLLARMYPVMLLDQYALPIVAWVGGLTALLAATIAMAQHDIKRIFAYSTISQLGYMFLGLGVLTSFGAAYHVFTHAFFKAVLFLTAGAVMHGFAGQLDLRKISGLRNMPGWRIVSYTMLIACFCLAGFPGTSGFFSKDAILAQAFVTPGYGFRILGWIAIITAGLTAYYTFRVWFRICAGPVQFEMGDEHHGDDHHGNQPHAPRFAINFVLIVITIGAVLAAVPFFMANTTEGAHGGWVAEMIYDSSAIHGLPHQAAGAETQHATLLGMDPHTAMYFVSGGIGIFGILIALYLHLINRKAADSLKNALLGNSLTRWLPTAMENKWYVDEIYHAIIRAPLWIIGHALNLFDLWFVDRGIVDGIARIPKLLGKVFQPLQNGILQSYGVSMAGGAGLIAVLVIVMPDLMQWLGNLLGGGG
ncbi:MAG: NADH-quinone oxidoreductase subunit L [Planctomycetes bacterium]|nr:NADH-quinone oxidoreductase subunit L [Planctomycetota bacterium]